MANITRIQNNQITDGTINAQYKVATGSITGNLIASNVTIQSNITILGNLTVSNSFTQLNSINTYINDPLVVFNNGYTGTPSYDVGILVNRNLQSLPGYGSVNAAWVWKEADAAFEALATTETGTTAGSMNNSGWANVKLGNTTAVSGTVTNSLTVGTTLGVTGATTLSSTLGVTGVSTLNGNVVAASGTASTSTTTGALVVAGGAGVSGNATIGGSAVITGDAYVQGGDIFTSATTFNLVNATATTVNFAGEATTLNTGNASGVTNMSGVTKHLGNIVAASGTASTTTTTGALVVAGGAGISGAVNIGGALGITGTSTFTGVGTFNANLVAASGTASTNTTTGALVVAGGAGISGATYIGGLINVTGAATLSSTVAVSGVATLNGNVVAASGTASTTTTTGALVVTGGAGISGALNIGGALGVSGNLSTAAGGLTTSATTAYVFNETATTLNVGAAATTINVGNASGTTNASGVVKVTGNIVAASGTASTTTTTGALVVAGGAGISGAIYAGSVQNTPIGSTTASTGAFTTLQTTNFSTGNAVISGGYISTLTNAAITTAVVTNFSSGNAVITGGSVNGSPIGVSSASTGAFTTLTASGATTLTNATESTTAGTGALIVSGGVGIAKNLNVTGSAVISGNLTVQGTLTAIQSNTLDVSDLNITVAKGAASAAAANGAGITVDGANATILYTNATDTWNLNKGLVATTGSFSSTLGVTGATTLSTATAGGLQAQAIGNVTAGTGAFTTLTSSGVLTSSGNIVAASGTASTTTTTGALVVTGGVGISGAMFLGGALTSTGNINDNGGGLTTSQTTGYLFNETVTTLNVGSAATALNLGATSGTATLANPTLVGTQTTQNVYNTVATTVNAFGAATTLNVGNASGVTTIAGVTKHSGNLVAASGITSTTTTTGALVVAGGAGISGNLNVGTTSSIHNIQGNVLIGLGPIGPSADSVFTINQNSNVPIYSGAIMHIAAADSTNGAISIDTYGGNTVGTTYSGRHARGSSSAPSAVQATDVLSAFIGKGYGATGFTNSLAPYNSAGVVIVANETFTDSSQATKVHLNYIQSGSTLGVAGLVVDSTGNVIVTQTTASTSFTTGALIVKGGVGVAGAAFLNDKLDVLLTTTSRGNLVAAATTVSSSTTTGALVVVGGAGIAGAVYLGSTVNITGVTTATGNIAINTATNAGLTTTQTTAYLFNESATTLNVGAAATTINIGNASGTTNASGVVKVTGNLVAASGTASTTATTGALVVTGGVGITGNVFLANAVTINSSQTAGQDFVVKGKNDSTLIWARPSATYDQVLIGNSATTGNLVTGAKLIINSSDSIILPVGSNAQRPSSVGGTDVAGMFRYSTQVSGPEYYNGSVWNSITSSFTIITDEQFNGTGSQVNFTLAGTTTTAGTIVSINGVMQIPTLAYSVSGTTLTFTEAPASTDIIDVRRLTTTQTISGIASTNGFMQFAVDNNGSAVYTGTAGTTATTLWNPSGAEVNLVGNVTLATASAPGQLDSFFANTYSSAEYTITSTIQGTNIREITKILVVTDGSSANTYRTVYGVTSTSGNTMTTWTANVTGSSVTLYGTPANANQIYRIRKNYQAV